MHINCFHCFSDCRYLCFGITYTVLNSLSISNQLFIHLKSRQLICISHLTKLAPIIISPLVYPRAVDQFSKKHSTPRMLLCQILLTFPSYQFPIYKKHSSTALVPITLTFPPAVEVTMKSTCFSDVRSFTFDKYDTYQLQHGCEQDSCTLL